jgi:hypothetical protein
VRWLLDTNTLSETIKRKPDRTVSEWIAEQPPMLLAISIMTIAEIQRGASTTNDQVRHGELARWLETMVIPTFEGRTLPLTSEILVDWLGLARGLARKGITRAAPDLLIASTARVHNLTLVTRNIRDFADTGIVVYDPWSDQTHRMDQP